MPATVVIIPVHGASAALGRCLDSVDRHTPVPRRVLVIDDASPADSGVAEVLASAGARAGFEVLSNPHNLGFAATCNRGMALAGAADVVLLNSDTVVGPGWLAGLEACARSAPRIGSVTPLSNNGTLASVPRWLADNPLPAGLGVDAMAALVTRVSPRIYPALPTGVGFCLWLGREALRAVGDFDVAAFGEGYGEENDWCLRAGARGFSHRLDDATFVFHEGGRSFGGTAAARQARAGRTLRARHPGYDHLVGAFIAADPFADLRRNLAAQLALAGHTGPRVLHLVRWPFDEDATGGVQRQGALLVRHLGSRSTHLAAWSAGAELRVAGATRAGPFGWRFGLPTAPADTVFEAPAVLAALADFLDAVPVDLVHIQSLLGWPPGVADVLSGRGVPWILTVHDYHLACPNYDLLEGGRRYCDLPTDPARCDACLGATRGLPGGTLARWRRAVAPLVDGAALVTAPSRTALALLTRVFPRAGGGRVVAHGVPAAPGVGRPGTTVGPLRVVVVGAGSVAKGRDVAAGVVRASAGLDIAWHALGSDNLGAALPSGVRDHGRYPSGTLTERLDALAADVVLLPSRTPETFSLTLSEVWASGRPVLGAGHGALGERLAHGGGWTFDVERPEEARAILARLCAHRDEVAARAAEARAMRGVSPEQMAEAWLAIYREVALGRSAGRGAVAVDGRAAARRVFEAFVSAERAPWWGQGPGAGPLGAFRSWQASDAWRRSRLRHALPEPLRVRLQPMVETFLAGLGRGRRGTDA